jgi:hypothetical protein
MAHRRRSVLATLAVAGLVALQLWSASLASARDLAKGPGRLVAPHHRFDGVTGGDAMGAGWYRVLSLPAADNPWFGNGERCVTLGHHRMVLLAIGNGPPQTCTVKQGTAVFVIGIMTFCDNVEPPPFFGADEAAQRDCAWALLRGDVRSIRLTVDDGKAVDLHVPRYASCSPQRRVRLLADNILGVPPQPATFTACGWVAWLTDLPPGRHALRSEATFTDGTEHLWSPVIRVVRGNH